MKEFIEWGAEAGLIVVHIPSEVLKFFTPIDRLNPNPTRKYPIVLVERWFSRNIFHYFPKKYLEDKGFAVYSLNYSMWKGSFSDSAANLKRFIEEKDLHDAILVGISGGASTCLEYLQFLNGWDRTRKFISIGGSLRGSPLGRIVPFIRSPRELIPESPYLKHVFSKPIDNLDRVFTITAKVDNLVPTKYGQLEGARNITLDMVGHNLLHTFWTPTYDLVAKIAEE